MLIMTTNLIMHLTPTERRIKNKIESPRANPLNPKNISAKSWIEASPLSQSDLARQFKCSNSVMKDLCQKLEVERHLKRGIAPASAGSKFHGKEDFGSISADKRRCTNLLGAARGGSKVAVEKLWTEFKIKWWKEGEEVDASNSG